MRFTEHFLDAVHPHSSNLIVSSYCRVIPKTVPEFYQRILRGLESRKRKLLTVTGLTLTMCMGAAHAAEYKLAIQPILPPAEIKVQYKALADYLSDKTGNTVTLQTFSSFKSYFANMKRKKGFDMVLDAAHFTNYRADKMNYNVLVKLPDTVSFSLVTGPDLMVFDA